VIELPGSERIFQKKVKEMGSCWQLPGKARLSKGMNQSQAEYLPTRQSLLERLKRWDDGESWRDFFNLYGRLLYSTAIKAGLNDAEAQDVVQDTIIMVAKKMGGFKYDPKVDSFKGWLLFLTRKRIAMEYRKRARARLAPAGEQNPGGVEIEEIADPATMELEAVWDEEWARTMWEAALARVKEQVAPKQFQMFDLYIIQERPATEVAQKLGVTVAQVYLAKHRISALLKKELAQLRTRFEKPGF
jgi:RNA polymerase sigma-70 factor (ECF subfamily)